MYSSIKIKLKYLLILATLIVSSYTYVSLDSIYGKPKAFVGKLDEVRIMSFMKNEPKSKGGHFIFLWVVDDMVSMIPTSYRIDYDDKTWALLHKLKQKYKNSAILVNLNFLSKNKITPLKEIVKHQRILDERADEYDYNHGYEEEDLEEPEIIEY
jgi:hypothetical protein